MAPAIRRLLESGLVAARVGESFDPSSTSTGRSPGQLPTTTLLAHPAALNAARTLLPEGEGPPRAGPRSARPASRTAWSRSSGSRRSGSGSRKGRSARPSRGPSSSATASGSKTTPSSPGRSPTPSSRCPTWPCSGSPWPGAWGWSSPRRGRTGWSRPKPEFWAENAVHLPQMIATRWLALRDWHEQAGMRQEGSPVDLAMPFLRAPGPALARPDAEAGLGRAGGPGRPRSTASAPAGTGPCSRLRRRLRTARGSATPWRRSSSARPIRLGLVRAAEEVPSGRRVVQLTPLWAGTRWRWGLRRRPGRRSTTSSDGPAQLRDHRLSPGADPDPDRPVQPVRPLVAGRRGPGIEADARVGLSRARRGPEPRRACSTGSGKHSARPLPAGVAEALRTWAGRRDRVTYHASATLVEFANARGARGRLRLCSDDRPRPVAPVRIGDRLLLVEDESSIPFTRFRMAGSRDYRRPAETCVDVEGDGVTLSLDLGRSDLLVDAELARFADERPSPQVRLDDGTAAPRAGSSSRPARSPGRPRTG